MAPAFLGLGTVIHGVRSRMNDLRRVMNQRPGVSLRLPDVVHDLPDVIRRVSGVENDLRAPFFYLPRTTLIVFVAAID